MHILETYYGLDEDDGTIAPEMTQSGFLFQTPQAPPPGPGGVGFQFG